MPASRIEASAKREALRRRIRQGRLTVMPGAFNAAVAQMVAGHGFGGVYVSGHMIAAARGLPDIGLTTSVEVAEAAGTIARMTDLPTIVDADAGFGSPLSAERTVQLLEDAGLAGCHIEDQADPKRVGGGPGLLLVEPEAAARRIRAAVRGRRDERFLVIARTDALPVEGMGKALDRARLYREAGADVIFVEGLKSAADVAAVHETGIAPMLVNVNELGGNRLTIGELERLGVAIAIYPMALMRLALGAAEQGLAALRASGSMVGLTAGMYGPEKLARLLDVASYEELVDEGDRR